MTDDPVHQTHTNDHANQAYKNDHCDSLATGLVVITRYLMSGDDLLLHDWQLLQKGTSSAIRCLVCCSAVKSTAEDP